MNERIKELALQAGFDEHWFEQHPTGCALPKPLMLKEYTELIVAECTKICNDNGDTYQYSFTPAKASIADNASKHCAVLINRFFGVKE